VATRTVRRPVRQADDDSQHFEKDPEETPQETSSRRSSTRPSRRAAPEPDEDDNNDRSRSRGRRRGGDDEGEGRKRGGSVRSGWGAWKEERNAAGGWAERFEVEYGKKYVIKFLEDVPAAAYRQHWFEELDGKKSWVCLNSSPEHRDEPCPLCVDLADKPSAKAVFNVIEFVDNEPILKTWTVGSGVMAEIEEHADDEKGGRLTGTYFLVWKVKQSGKGGRGGATTYHVTRIKDRDLKEDHDVDALSDEELDEFEEKKYTAADLVTVPTRKRLQELVEELAGD